MATTVYEVHTVYGVETKRTFAEAKEFARYAAVTTGTTTKIVATITETVSPPSAVTGQDRHGNTIALEGCDRCFCGVKYWENDRCIDCGTHISEVKKAEKAEKEGATR